MPSYNMITKKNIFKKMVLYVLFLLFSMQNVSRVAKIALAGYMAFLIFGDLISLISGFIKIML